MKMPEHFHGFRGVKQNLGLARGKSLVRVGAVGIRIRETPLRFPNSWAGGQTFPSRGNLWVEFAPVRGHLRHAEGGFYPQFLVESLTKNHEGEKGLNTRQTGDASTVKRSHPQAIPRKTLPFHRLSPNTPSWGISVR